jgi:hypothetical protein
VSTLSTQSSISPAAHPVREHSLHAVKGGGLRPPPAPPLRAAASGRPRVAPTSTKAGPGGVQRIMPTSRSPSSGSSATRTPSRRFAARPLRSALTGSSLTAPGPLRSWADQIGSAGVRDHAHHAAVGDTPPTHAPWRPPGRRRAREPRRPNGAQGSTHRPRPRRARRTLTSRRSPVRVRDRPLRQKRCTRPSSEIGAAHRTLWWAGPWKRSWILGCASGSPEAAAPLTRRSHPEPNSHPLTRTAAHLSRTLRRRRSARAPGTEMPT